MRALPPSVMTGFYVASGGVVLYCLCRALGTWRGWASPHIELGNLSEGLGALFTVAAVVAALVIAGRDRRDRIAERHDAEKPQARLVLLTVHADSRPAASITAEVRNFGPLPVLDVELYDAHWIENPTARVHVGYAQFQGVSHTSSAKRRPALMPTRDYERTNATALDFGVVFMHETDDRPLTEPTARTAAYPVPNYEPIDLSNVVVKLRFTTADGVRWETPTVGAGPGEPVRLERSAE